MRLGLVVLMLVASLAAKAAPPNIILISVDTLRPDHLPTYGYRGIRTPQLDRFRADAVLFDRAWSPYPLTAPAHASMLTGLLPAEHGLRDNSGWTLAARAPTVAEELARRGYATAAIVSSRVLAAKTGLGRGFALYDSPAAAERDGAQTAASALRWIGRQKQPFFLLLHLYEPHAPYRGSYDEEIVRVDTILGTFFAELRRLRLYDGALIVFVSDHGEGLGEHGEKQHGVLLHRTTLQVPLIVKFPNNARRGGRVTADAQLIDLAPTMLVHAGAAERAKALPGASLLALAATRDLYAETLYPRDQLGWHELHSLIRGNLHLIAGRRVELYDLARDPRELTNLADTQRHSAFAMLQALRGLTSDTRASPTAAPDESLLGLGYLSGGSADETTFHPHPADRMMVFNPTLQLMTALRRKQFTEALRIADEILAAHPEFPEVWERKAMALLGLGRKKDAEEALRRAAAVTPR
jgi:choline-sulfatase